MPKPMLLSDVAQKLLWLDGETFSLRDYPMYRAIYDGRFKSTLLMCGRQDAWANVAQHQAMLALAVQAKMAVVEDAGHMILMERPQETSQAITQFLN